MNSTSDIRTAFLEYFKQAGHEIVPSAPLVPQNDPTLMFVNAGMVPFKNVFTGAESRPWKTAASSQKCVRAGGKHNDLDNVGYTARHHTFFEMLGNFSFGDYFKEQAITLAWQLIHGEFGLAKERLYVTVYHEDQDAFDLWRKISGLPENQIIRIATADNFWSMGDTGPCGPCSEIFYDHGDHIPGGPPGSAEEDGERFVEIWNLVFMQYEQITKEERIDLPKPSIDTGMGLERIAAVMQGTHDNYETDLFRHLINASVSESGVAATGKHKASHRVIADHLRASSFLIADGVLPSNEGRGYVLRRIMRRAMRHAHLLGVQDLLIYRLVPALISQMGVAYPELGRASALITETLKLEEGRFRKTLDRGLKLLTQEVEKLSNNSPLPGEVAFKLYDTYGFPLDLTEDAMRAEGRAVELAGFNKAMEHQKAEARAAWSGSGEAVTERVWFDIRERVGATDFTGYSAAESEGEILAIVREGEETECAAEGDTIAIITNQTPFYGESGGQVGDSGVITTTEGAELTVSDTRKKLGDLHVHMGILNKGTMKTGDTVLLRLDNDRRALLRANHSATHLMNAALRRVLGPHVSQKGSMVGPDKLRFDFSHQKPLTDEEVRAIETDVNRMILGNTGVTTRLMATDDAIEAGAVAMFGEKYGDEVRVVSMGQDVAESGKAFSVELCGGTHVTRLGDIGVFKISGQSAVAAGIRRIEAVTGEAARAEFIAREDALKAAAEALKTPLHEVPDRVTALVAERKSLENQLQDARKKLALGGGDAKAVDAELVAGISFLGQVLDGVSPKDLRGLADDAKARIGSGVVAFVAVNNGRAAILTGVTNDLTGRFSAVDLVRIGAATLGGSGGGGRPDMAQAGGPDGDKATDAITAIRGAIEKSETAN